MQLNTFSLIGLAGKIYSLSEMHLSLPFDQYIYIYKYLLILESATKIYIKKKLAYEIN